MVMVQPYARVNSGWAIASFGLGIVTLFAFAVLICAGDAPIFDLCLLVSPPLSVICGAIALLHISRNRNTVTGSEWAVIGTILGVIAMVVLIPPFFLRDRGRPVPTTSCLNNLKQIGTTLAMYEGDWDDKYPRVSGPGREFERVYGWTYNYRTKSTTGERRWFQNLVGPYAKNTKIFMCPVVGQDGTWKIPGKGTVRFLYNRHGGFSRDDPKPVDPPEGSTAAGLKLENDPPTSYWFNAYVTQAGKQDKVISGRSEKICDKSADAPIVWDTPCGFDNGSGDAQIAHDDVINVCYADGHARPFQIPNPKDPTAHWLDKDFMSMHGSDGWYPEK
jgi:prepilin-type processing-associated H-X9-DG protein